MKTFIALTLLALVSISGAVAIRHSGPADAIGLGGGHVFACDGKTIGFWTNPHGEALITAGNFLSVLPSLHVVDEFGNPFTTDDFDVFKDWMQHANAVNMAYMLSAQLVAMKFNVLAGNVDENCTIRTPTGEPNIGDLIDKAIQALIQDPYTPAGDTHRRGQQALKDLLDAANNNLNWS